MSDRPRYLAPRKPKANEQPCSAFDLLPIATKIQFRYPGPAYPYPLLGFDLHSVENLALIPPCPSLSPRQGNTRQKQIVGRGSRSARRSTRRAVSELLFDPEETPGAFGITQQIDRSVLRQARKSLDSLQLGLYRSARQQLYFELSAQDLALPILQQSHQQPPSSHPPPPSQPPRSSSPSQIKRGSTGLLSVFHRSIIP